MKIPFSSSPALPFTEAWRATKLPFNKIEIREVKESVKVKS